MTTTTISSTDINDITSGSGTITDSVIGTVTDAGSSDDESLLARRPVARCADGNGTLTALFFSDHVADIARAKAMCGLCPLQAECLAGALEREEPWGVWGGELISGGRVIANKRPCGRPPKHPRPELVYDEMGPVAPEPVAV
ncbi:MAG: WhiB family transcriptional regulator [Actinomycetota bacterium]